MLKNEESRSKIESEIQKICKEYGVSLVKERKKKAKMRDTSCQTNDYEAHWTFLKQTKLIKNKNELKKFMTGVEVPELLNRNYSITRKRSLINSEDTDVLQKKRKIEKKQRGPPTKKSENGLDLSESE